MEKWSLRKAEWQAKVTKQTGGPGFKLGCNCATLVVSVFGAGQQKWHRTGLPRGCSSPPQSIQITLDFYHRVRNSATWFQETKSNSGQKSRKVKQQDRGGSSSQKASEHTQNHTLFLHSYYLWGQGVETVKNPTLINKMLSSLDWRKGNSWNFSRKLICINFPKTHTLWSGDSTSRYEKKRKLENHVHKEQN